MFTINTNKDATASKKYMTAEFRLNDEHAVRIGKVFMTKKFNNRMSKEKQAAVRGWLKENASREFDVKDGLKIELIFNQDKSKVEITFVQRQSKRQEY